MSEFPNIEQLRESVRRMGPNWVETDPNFEVSWWSIPDRDFQSFADAARFLLSVLDEGGRLEVVVPCEREGGIIHERADGSECPYYGHHVCDKCGWIDPEHKGEYVSCGERTVVWPTDKEAVNG